MAEQRFSMKDAIAFGWDTMKNNTGFFMGLLIIAVLIENIPTTLGNIAKKDFPLLSIIFSIAGMIISSMVQMGLIKVSLKFCEGTKGKLDDLLSNFHLVLNFIAGSVLYFLITVGGLILFIVPGIVWGVKYSLFVYFIVDEELGPIEAIKASGRATEDAKMDLFLFGFLIVLMNLAGALLFIIGLFITVPISMVAYAYIYRELSGQDNEAPMADQSDPPKKTPSETMKRSPKEGAKSPMYINLEP